ncbi:NAD(P)-dependent oxidoreductase [Marinilabiliaceae bacterium ANBcel2]|nr:NAD(P)-dependent oxidoreductase [Marinilabiliaceae bacterium ANBcel2]
MIVVNIEPLNYSEKAVGILSRHFIYFSTNSVDTIPEDILSKAEVVITRLNYRIDSNFIEKFPSCRFIVTATTGLDHIDMEALKKQDIEVISLKGEEQFLKSISSTAEHTVALILSLVRNIKNAVKSVEAGDWNRDLFRGIQLKNRVLGIVGMGRTGSMVSNYCKALGMEIIYFDPFVTNLNYRKIDNLKTLFELSDIVSLHVHLNDETEGMINSSVLKWMKRGGYLINTSRGAVINEDDVVDAINMKILRGVAVDVIVGEPYNLSSSSLYRAMLKGANIIITPHIGGASTDAMRSCEEFVASKVVEKCTSSLKI